MKIVMIGTAYPMRGGIAHFNELLFRTLEARGHEMRMISFSRQYPSLFFPGKTQYEENESPDHIESEPLLDSIGPLSWLRTAKRVREINPDLVIFKYWMPFFAPAYTCVAKRAKSGRKTKILYVCDNIIPHERRPGDRNLTRMALATVDYFIVMSKSVKSDLLQLKADARHQMVQHPVYEIFPGNFSKEEARERLALPSGRLVLFFGYIRRYKGLHVLLEALALVLKKLDVKLLVAGEFYDEKSGYLRKIDDLGIGDHVIVHDRYIPNDQVGLYYAAADVVALPYLSATQSGIVQICYHYNRPVIATNVGGLPEVVHDQGTGFIVRANDPTAFAEAILRFYRENRETEFSVNVEIAKKDFSWERMAEAIEELASVNEASTQFKEKP
jgi:D-inositol-3-phosphate glycosyltransferase